ncbi:MAG: Smr/MutS family protein [Alphaproteobacteria bacterium]
MASDKDKQNWDEAIKGANPLGKTGKVSAEPPKIYPRHPRRLDDYSPFDFKSGASKHQSDFDPLLFSKIASGKVRIQFSFDLHGMSEAEAFEALLGVLGDAYLAGRRYGLIVTGKGRLGGSPIRAMLPKWLTSPKLSQIVSSFTYSAKNHGGDGAFYVLLRRQVK